ncbi:MAG TPA: mechanosensitive ion channel family protein [Intrasporangium sp.]|uniref:mechanosensitive ion channel family protein n=1 Tax=Intrasporangium sp. TaxID=1925024 RepID=UPI002D7921C1|nr:mechanosensitive ion channel family protein [Intrasporangium sp.]HET7398588.1 mechanosensitive ion channel family protein [Intrasporangium sp.]
MPQIELPALTWAQTRDWLLGDPLSIAITVVVALVARWAAFRLIDRVVDTATQRHTDRVVSLGGRAGRVLASAVGVDRERHVQRTRTMGAILRSIVSFVIATIALLTVMAIVGIPLGPMLASAGVGGVALGFGAQSLVKDFLSGIFMIVEDQYGVGDVVDTGEVVGTVENVSLRVTQLRDGNGVTWYVRNGEILRIGNRSQGWSMAMVDVPIAYDEDVERAQRVIRDVVGGLHEDALWADRLIEEPEVVGVESIAGGSITIRILAKCVAQEHFAVQREMRERIKLAFDREGVRGPVVLPTLPPPGPVGRA